MSEFSTPILFIIFNRPAPTRQVFASIRAQQPRQLFVAADGARDDKAGEADLVKATRAIIADIDWPCEVKYLFRDHNAGCGRAVSEAISWFFSHVEEGIILEDDCLPHPDFFSYCETLLQRYRFEPRVATIAGTHFLPPEFACTQSHYVSKYFQMWGWATWRRTWTTYSHSLDELDEAGWWSVLERTHANPVQAAYWREVYRALKAGVFDTWDFQVFFHSWRAGACHVMPGRNLISNLGYGPEATHTNFESPMANLPVAPLRIPPHETIPLEPNPVVDDIIFFLRFLESLHQTWWVEQVLSPEGKLGHARAELLRKDRRLHELEREVADKRRQLLAATRALAQASANESRAVSST
ncbi:glycosyltransferase family 2 protein [Horticoccus luteus]|uniref:Glycosyltransferase family 2 protein n=1 Tax=Horticoccus luteus TaxID=2862869 RepID=A0A8F9TXE4_9BACT|nr:glycosyltransferase family 2 protein [Horticoccus luteus]QYM79782.1 glycosyltransferase family 2 protein [Horticoccus luteus]